MFSLAKHRTFQAIIILAYLMFYKHILIYILYAYILLLHINVIHIYIAGKCLTKYNYTFI